MRLLLCILLLLLEAQLAHGEGSSYEYHQELDEGYRLFWNITEDELRVQIEVREDGWIALGFHPVRTTSWDTVDADLYVGILHNDTLDAEITDRFLIDHPIPLTDVEHNCTDDVLQGSVHKNMETGVTVLRFSRKLRTGDPCDLDVVPGLYSVIYSYGSLAVPFDFSHGKEGRATVQFVEVRNETAPVQPEIKVVAASSGLFRFFVVVVFLAGVSLTFGWIAAHFLRNRRTFKPDHVVKTMFPSSFVLPVDLKTARYILLVTAAVHLVISLPTVSLGGVSFLLIATPLVGAASALIYSPLLGIVYMCFNLISILTHFSFLVSKAFSYCKYSTDSEANLCDSASKAQSTLFLVAVVILFLFEFIAYSFVYRLLRYKAWLAEQAMLEEPAEFEYQKMSSSKDY